MKNKELLASIDKALNGFTGIDAVVKLLTLIAFLLVLGLGLEDEFTSD